MEKSEVILYTSPDGTTKLQVHIDGDTVWLNREQFATDAEVCREFRHTTKQGALKDKSRTVTVEYYNIVRK